MPLRRVLPGSPAKKPSRAGVPVSNLCPQVLPLRKSFGIDELVASPWIGLHYRHEFLLHYKHELLEQHLERYLKIPRK